MTLQGEVEMKAFYGFLVLLLLCAGVQAVVGEEYVFVTKWGNEGMGDGQFGWLRGIAADASGNVYTAETDFAYEGEGPYGDLP